MPGPSENVLAIGLGAQVLPGKGKLPQRESPKEMAQDIVGELRRSEREEGWQSRTFDVQLRDTKRFMNHRHYLSKST